MGYFQIEQKQTHYVCQKSVQPSKPSDFIGHKLNGTAEDLRGHGQVRITVRGPGRQNFCKCEYYWECYLLLLY